jgi:hypothetical protein
MKGLPQVPGDVSVVSLILLTAAPRCSETLPQGLDSPLVGKDLGHWRLS